MQGLEVRSLEDIENEISQTEKGIEEARGTPTEVYARIVGYYRAVRNWNAGKSEEYKHRKTFDMADSDVQGHLPEVAEESAESMVPTEPVPEEVKAKGKLRYLLFYRQTCPNCPPVKRELAKYTLANEWVDVDTPEGLELARKFNVSAAPTVVLLNGDEAIAYGTTVNSVRDMFASHIAV